MTATVLVVDDEPDLETLILQKFRRQIREGLISFIFAHDGIEALASIESCPHVDMVVSDINMPRMDGLSLLARLQEAADRKSTVIVSAYGDMGNIRTAMNRGAFDFLTKPIDFGDLEVTIDRTIRHVGAMREARRRQLQAEHAHASLSRYFSPEIARRLASDGEGMEVHWRDVAVIFTDITGFTTLVEMAAPEILGELLNEYVAGMTDAVFACEGTVAKVIGDAIQILFNAPGDQPDYAMRAINCALDLDRWAQAFRERWAAKGISFGITRIGVHAGSALVGNFGGNRFFDYTAYGDTINTAARLEAANKQLGTRIFSESSTFLLSEVFARTPKDVLSANFGVPEAAFDRIPKEQLFIFEAPVPAAIDNDGVTSPQGVVPRSMIFRASDQKAETSSGGSVRIVDTRNFLIATEVAAAIVEVAPKSMREIHWHPNADEWQYYLSGTGRMTVFASQDSSRTFDFRAGDVGYVPKSMSHYVQNTGDEPLKFLELFRSPRFEDVSLNQWLALTPSLLVRSHLGLDQSTIDKMSKTKRNIV